MMMKMLEAGGIPPITDNLRTADDDNPKGYEFERGRRCRMGDKDWVPEAAGQVGQGDPGALEHCRRSIPTAYLHAAQDGRDPGLAEADAGAIG
jgi:hypothetical protein